MHKENAGFPDDKKSSSLEVGRFVAKGATQLFLAKLASQVVGIIGSIVLVRLLVSPSVYALIGIATTVPGLVMLGDITGVNAALTRYLSMHKREGDSKAIWSAFWTASWIKILTGVALSFVAFFAATPISLLIGKTTALPFLEVASPLPVVWSLQVSLKSTLLSLGRSRNYALLDIFNEILLSFSPILAVLAGFGAMGALIAMVIANYVYLGAAFLASVAAVFAETERAMRKVEFMSTAKKLVRFGLPIGFSTSFSSFSSQVVNLIIARYVNLTVYGLYSVAQSASGIVGYATDPISSMLLAGFSRVRQLNEGEIMRSSYRQAIRFSTAIVLPIALFLVIFGTPFVTLLFGQAYRGGGVFVSILAAAGLTYGFGADATTSLLTSRGFSRYAGAMSMITSSVVLLAASLTLPTMGLQGYLVASIFAFFPGYMLSVRKAKTQLGLFPPLSEVKYFYLALVPTGLVSIGLIFARLPLAIENLAGALLISATYVLCAIVFRGLSMSDAKHLRNMLSTQPLISAALGPFIRLLERLIKLLQ